MVSEPFTEYHNTPNKSYRQNVARRGVVLHHAAMTNLDALIYLEMGAKEVSSNSTCKDYRLPEMFDTDGPWRAWSLSDAYWDSALRSVETCNESTDGWTVSAASHRTLAKVVAYWAEKDGFWPHRSGDPETWTVLGHREVYSIHGGSYGTACPGALDLDLVTRLAQEILKGSSTAGGGGSTPIPIEEDEEMKFVFGHRNEGGDEWVLIHPDIKLDDTQDGYMITTSRAVATSWGRMYKNGSSDYDFDVNRADYVQIQAQARYVARSMRAQRSA